MPTIEDDPDWKDALQVTVHWFECGVGFDCICGEPDLIISDAGEDRTCDKCGRMYWLGIQFKMKEPTT